MLFRARGDDERLIKCNNTHTHYTIDDEWEEICEWKLTLNTTTEKKNVSMKTAKTHRKRKVRLQFFTPGIYLEVLRLRIGRVEILSIVFLYEDFLICCIN